MWLVLKDSISESPNDTDREIWVVNQLIARYQPAVSIRAATAGMTEVQRMEWMYAMQKVATRLVVIPTGMNLKIPTEQPQVISNDARGLITAARRSGTRPLFTSSTEWARATTLSQIYE